MEALYTPIFGDLLPPNGLGNTYWMSNQPTYEDHQGDAGYGQGNIEAARAKLEEAGYVDEGGVFTHPTDGPLTLRVGTTGGNRLREVQQQLLQEQLSEAGFDIQINNVEGGDYFSASRSTRSARMRQLRRHRGQLRPLGHRPVRLCRRSVARR